MFIQVGPVQPVPTVGDRRPWERGGIPPFIRLTPRDTKGNAEEGRVVHFNSAEDPNGLAAREIVWQAIKTVMEREAQGQGAARVQQISGRLKHMQKDLEAGDRVHFENHRQRKAVIAIAAAEAKKAGLKL